MSSRYVRAFDSRAERLVAPQEPARVWGGKPRTQTGMILPYGRGAYRHDFGAEPCGECDGLAAVEGEQGMPFMAWVLILGCGGALLYTLLHAART
jgi:hypothetical protein